MMNRHDRRVWEGCESLEDLAAATVAWLSGDVEETPGHMGPPDPETAAIRDDLITLNRAGLITTMSQPGLIEPCGCDGQGCDLFDQQRAALEAYGTPEVTASVRAAVASAGEWTERALDGFDEPVWRMASRWQWRRRRRERRIVAPITRAVCAHGEVYAEYTAMPLHLAHHEHRFDWTAGSGIGAAGDALEGTHRIVVWDRQWGRERALWDALRGALVDPEEAV